LDDELEELDDELDEEFDDELDDELDEELDEEEELELESESKAKLFSMLHYNGKNRKPEDDTDSDLALFRVDKTSADTASAAASSPGGNSSVNVGSLFS
jgi:hypothetical protein